jgi:hypothetical protein
MAAFSDQGRYLTKECARHETKIETDSHVKV